jgi:hypothetical protein
MDRGVGVGALRALMERGAQSLGAFGDHALSALGRGGARLLDRGDDAVALSFERARPPCAPALIPEPPDRRLAPVEVLVDMIVIAVAQRPYVGRERGDGARHHARTRSARR